MSRKILQLNPTFLKYILVGIITTLIGVLVFYGLLNTLLSQENAIELQLANIISWICAVAFAFFANKRFVFNDNDNKTIIQIALFVGGRLSTLLLENALLFVFVSLLHFESMIIKFFLIIITTSLNYIISRKAVFRNSQ